MFTLTQIKTAHGKVKSGGDFPKYIQDLKELGVLYYNTFVSDGHTDYYGHNGYKISTTAKYEILKITQEPNVDHFKTGLIAHQQGKTDYPTFCTDCATSGVEKWCVNIENMSCTYYDKAGDEILIEQVPQ